MVHYLSNIIKLYADPSILPRMWNHAFVEDIHYVYTTCLLVN